MLKSSLIAKTEAKANENQMYIGDCYRVTVLTNRLIRFEYSKEKKFVDLASYAVWFRKFDGISFSVIERGTAVIVETDEVKFFINKKNGKPQFVEFKENGRKMKCDNKDNLKGTCRTLDMTFGKTKLTDGLITKNGVYVLDDSNSVLIDENGKFQPREGNNKDLYIFAYEKNYRETIKAFYKISSPVPLIPRFALGVWWSRYHAYTQKEYLDLMARFKHENIPLTVATVDMDWHWVKEKDIYGTFGVKYDGCGSYGWTGYSWNTELFPDYKQFLNKLKEDNLHVTLNLHPADGVHSYEDMYEEMAKAVGIDPKTKEKVKFQCGSDTFWNAYFDVLHKPYEKDGVDFWWIDWQQGKKSDVKGLDPLNALNHYHYLDNAENEDIPLILSRYGGIGSHRYPLGFSGDTAINWKVFDFQPYFTANAANAAYTWWSHDIGGHHMGFRDDELYIRWLQFGVFSPIMRLHSTATELLGKEPWKYRADVYSCAKEWLNLRHSLIPYIFTMDYRNHKDGIALCEPMYYAYPENKNAYDFKNQYMFGSELMVCPITSKQNKKTNFGEVKAWLPKGRWTDIFTGQSYNGDKVITLHRDLNCIPVLAKEGAVIPFAKSKGNDISNPEELEIWIYSGNNSFVLYEDNGKTDFENHNAKTVFRVSFDEEKKQLHFAVDSPAGDTDVIPKSRKFRLVFRDLCVDNLVCNDYEISSDNGNAVIEISDFTADSKVEITLDNAEIKKTESIKEQLICILSRWQEKTFKKAIAYKPFANAETREEIRNALRKSRLPKAVSSVVKELLETI
ncbi:MAG: glycoside hydrolase family 31 protein [Eubacterium sp.]|nr:glycoside hydrolase family 31 protein [Eubacterium sp.]